MYLLNFKIYINSKDIFLKIEKMNNKIIIIISLIENIINNYKTKENITTNHTIPLKIFIEESLKRSKTTFNTLITAFIYFSNFTRIGGADSRFNEREIFAGILILAHKYLSDSSYSNKVWANNIFGLDIKTINKIEIYILHKLNYNLYISFDYFKTSRQIFIKKMIDENIFNSFIQVTNDNKLIYQTYNYENKIIKLTELFKKIEEENKRLNNGKLNMLVIFDIEPIIERMGERIKKILDGKFETHLCDYHRLIRDGYNSLLTDKKKLIEICIKNGYSKMYDLASEI